MRGGSGIVVDGCMRDVPDHPAMPISIYLRCGHASSVSPILMSVDYQVPVRIGSVTIIPGAENWPHFERNLSEQYEARLTLELSA